MASIQNENTNEFETADVSEPQEIRRERDIIREERAMFRRMWIRDHLPHIFIAVGIILVLLVFLVVRNYQDFNNPISKLMGAAAKDFDSSFAFEMVVSEDGAPVMTYSGTADPDRSSQHISLLYQAKYTDYEFTAATLADEKRSVSGNMVDGKWRVKDCTSKVQDFFDFDTDFKKGKIDTGAFLRFADKTSDYSAGELSEFIEKMSKRIYSDKSLATVTTSKTDDGTVYKIELNAKNLLEMIVNDGASVFYRSSDYINFRSRFTANEQYLEGASCVIDFTVKDGYLTEFNISASAEERVFSVGISFSDFGTATVEIPEDFIAEADKMIEKARNSTRRR